MKLTAEDVRHLAELARIELTESEVEAFREDAESILGYVERIRNVDTSGVRMHTPPARGEGEWRQDVPLACDEETGQMVREQFPNREGDLLRTPAIFENPKKMK